jgi:hypothetical protein
MARHPFGLTNSDWTFDATTVSGTGNVAVVTSHVLTFWNAFTGGSQYTDLALDAAGLSPVSSITTGDGVAAPIGEWPSELYGPDNVFLMWVSASADGTAPRVKVLATDVPDIVAALNAAFSSHTTSVNPHNTGLGDLSDAAVGTPASRTAGDLVSWDAASSKFKMAHPAAVSGAVLLNPPLDGSGHFVGQTVPDIPVDLTANPAGNPWLTMAAPWSAGDTNPDMWQFFAEQAAGPGTKVKVWWWGGNFEARAAPSAINRVGFRVFEFAEGFGGPSTGTFFEVSTNPTIAANREKLLAAYGTGHSTKPGWIEATRVLSAIQSVAAGGGFSGTQQVMFVGRKTTTGAPSTGSWVTGMVIIDSAGVLWLCTAGGTPGTWVSASGGSFAGLGGDLINGNSAAVFRGRVTFEGPPTSGTWTTGDWVIDNVGHVQLCTAGGTPGTWKGDRAPTAWADVPSLGTNVAHGTPHCQYRTTTDGNVEFKGQLTYSGAVTTIFTMPSGSRPPATVNWSNRVLAVSVSNVSITVTSAGVVTTSAAGVSGQTQNFDGLFYSLT